MPEPTHIEVRCEPSEVKDALDEACGDAFVGLSKECEVAEKLAEGFNGEIAVIIDAIELEDEEREDGFIFKNATVSVTTIDPEVQKAVEEQERLIREAEEEAERQRTAELAESEIEHDEEEKPDGPV